MFFNGIGNYCKMLTLNRASDLYLNEWEKLNIKENGKSRKFHLRKKSAAYSVLNNS